MMRASITKQTRAMMQQVPVSIFSSLETSFEIVATKLPLLFLFIISASQLNGQVGKPEILSPVGPSPQFPPFSWTEVSGATEYKLILHTVKQACPGVTFYESKPETATVEAKKRCSNGKCGFRLTPGQGYPPGVTSTSVSHFGGYIHCVKDVNNNLIVFTWTVQAANATSSGQESEPASYSLEVAPPPTPPPPNPPNQDAYTVTCVFQTGNDYWAWYNGLYTALVNSYGQVAPGVFGKTFKFSSAPFQNCTGLAPGATPVGSAKFAVKNIAVCTNLVTGAQETFINALCPKRAPYVPSAAAK